MIETEPLPDTPSSTARSPGSVPPCAICAECHMRGDLFGVVEIRDDAEAGTYRTAYAAKLGARIYVHHAFQKKSRRGIETPQSGLIRAQLRASRDHADRAASGGQKS